MLAMCFQIFFVLCEMIPGRTYNRLGDGLSDGVDLGSVSTTSDTDSDVNTL